MSDKLNSHAEARAYAEVVQYRRRYDDDACLEQVVEVELVDTADGEIELCFELREMKDRTYLRMRVADLRRLLKQCKP